jgi:hypothetical protein
MDTCDAFSIKKILVIEKLHTFYTYTFKYYDILRVCVCMYVCALGRCCSVTATVCSILFMRASFCSPSDPKRFVFNCIKSREVVRILN